MGSNIKENEKGYNIWSSFYDTYSNPTVAIDELIFPGVYENVRKQKVLEVGCGTGRHTQRLIAAENSVTGIDISEGMLTKLRAKISSPCLSLIKGDFLSETLVGAPFDSIVASLVLEHIPNLLGFFESARKALKIGGQVYLSEIHPDRTAAGTFAHFKKSDGVEVHLKSLPHSSSEISQAAVQAGFEIKMTSSFQGNIQLVRMNPVWEKYLGKPMIQIWTMELMR